LYKSCDILAKDKKFQYKEGHDRIKGDVRNGKELLFKTSLDAQRLYKNGPAADGIPKDKKEETCSNNSPRPALLRRQSLFENPRRFTKNQITSTSGKGKK